MKKLFFLIAIIGCTSCAQLSQFQSARTVGKQNIAIGGTVSAYGLVDDDDGDIINKYVILPYAAGRLSYGLGEKVDLNASLSTGGNILLSPKFQFLGNRNSNWAASLEPGVGIQFAPNDGSMLMRYRLIVGLSHFLPNQHSITFKPGHIIQVEQEAISDPITGALSPEYFHFSGATLSYQIPWRENLQLGFGLSLFRPYSERNTNNGVLFNLGAGLQYLIPR